MSNSSIFYEHYSDAEKDWSYEYFKPKEIASKGESWAGGGSLLVNHEAMDTLEASRKLVGSPFLIWSAYRSPLHNAMVGGAPKSAHKDGIAFDISIVNHNKQDLLEACMESGFGSFGFYTSFLHVDMRKGRVWGSW
jgi:zinc D-Ala-D-Ala carboxypeptidase|tara:strand:+ start:721 stop:1128 length:408 start_codon:yes stop_codon:yes gene_type:complete